MKRRVKVMLTELMDASVDFVSLVDRSSSRMPVRVMKSAPQESHMLDLNNPLKALSRAFKTEKIQPQVTAVIVNSQEDAFLVEVAGAIEQAGYAVDKVTKNEDGTVMYSQVENPLEEATLVRVSEELLFVVKGLDNANYAEIAIDQGASAEFLPGVTSAMDTLHTGITSALNDAATPVDAQAAVSALVKKFSAYVETFVGDMPVKTFKAEKLLDAVLVTKAAKMSAPAMSEEKEKETGMAETPAEEAAESPAMQASEALAEATDHTKALMESLAELDKTLKSLAMKVDATATDIAGIKEAQSASERRIDEAVKKADTATHALNTTVLAAPPADTPVGEVAQKSEFSDPRTGCFDTAYLRQKSR